jgi:DNA-binding FadR family transcriptional regulator
MSREAASPASSVRAGELSRGIANGRLYQAAQHAIKAYILDRKLRPGDALLPEGDLAAELGISRNSLREAVKALESLGILESRHGVGLFVKEFSFDPILENLAYGLLIDRSSVAELLDVREQLESSYVARVAETVTTDQLRVLRSAADRMAERAAVGEGFPEEDRLFHRALYANIGNSLLLRLLDVFWEVYRRLLAESAVVMNDDPVRSWEGHRRIVEALERRDGAAARSAMLAHFSNIEDRLRRAGLVSTSPLSATKQM